MVAKHLPFGTSLGVLVELLKECSLSLNVGAEATFLPPNEFAESAWGGFGIS